MNISETGVVNIMFSLTMFLFELIMHLQQSTQYEGKESLFDWPCLVINVMH
jgi:hypothetical protein